MVPYRNGLKKYHCNLPNEDQKLCVWISFIYFSRNISNENEQPLTESKRLSKEQTVDTGSKKCNNEAVVIDDFIHTEGIVHKR